MHTKAVQLSSCHLRISPLTALQWTQKLSSCRLRISPLAAVRYWVSIYLPPVEELHCQRNASSTVSLSEKASCHTLKSVGFTLSKNISYWCCCYTVRISKLCLLHWHNIQAVKLSDNITYTQLLLHCSTIQTVAVTLSENKSHCCYTFREYKQLPLHCQKIKAVAVTLFEEKNGRS